MLFLQFVQYSLSFAGTPKNAITGAVLELCQSKIKQFPPDILKFSTQHEENPFTLNYFMNPRTVMFIFHSGSDRLGSNNFRNSSCQEKTVGSARVSRLSFRFLWLWYQVKYIFALGDSYSVRQWACVWQSSWCHFKKWSSLAKFTILIFWSPVCTPLIPCHYITEMAGGDLAWNNIQRETWREGSPPKLPT